MTEDLIFTPLKFRNLTVKNRIFRSNISGRFDNEDGSLTQTRINWECKFAAGGIGAIISSYVPVLMEGRIIAGYATVHRDDFIPLWKRLGEAVHRFDCKYIMQLSHSGRQMDLPGVHNSHRPSLSSTGRKESLHGFLCRAAGKPEIDQLVNAFAAGAWRAREAGLDGVELHAANGYLFTQFLSSGINDRTDEYGGSLQNRARFLLEVVRASVRASATISICRSSSARSIETTSFRGRRRATSSPTPSRWRNGARAKAPTPFMSRPARCSRTRSTRRATFRLRPSRPRTTP